jgi:outer membrane lipoprotein-sorting protein
MNKLLIVLILFTTNIYAQDEIAKSLLEKLSENAKNYDNIYIEFDLMIENKNQNISEKQEGIIEIAKEKFRLQLEDQFIVNNGESQWIYLVDMNEVQIINNSDLNELMNPINIFTIYERDYKYNYVGTTSENGLQIQNINLFPKTSKEFIKINIEIDASKNQLRKIKIYDKNGGILAYMLKKISVNTILEPFIFEVEDYKDIEIIDLR